MNDIANREDIILMVNSFYKTVRKDVRLKFLFDDTAQVHWESHLPKMYDFWESILFDKAIFQGDPMAKHVHLHQIEKLKASDFDMWLLLFKTNIDLQFEGKIAEKAKQRAESIATMMKIKTVYAD
jgi:hemoglobin